MHYTEDYSTMQGIDKLAKALADVRSYLGKDKFDKITSDFRKNEPPSIGYFQLCCAMLGIQHYPVHVWYVHTWGLTAYRSAKQSADAIDSP